MNDDKSKKLNHESRQSSAAFQYAAGRRFTERLPATLAVRAEGEVNSMDLRAIADTLQQVRWPAAPSEDSDADCTVGA